jgi:hypothetical protein
MTDAARTPTTATPATSANIPAQFLKLAKHIQNAENVEGAPAGSGVTVNYSANYITGTFTLPIQRADQGDGELVTVVNFIK